MDKNIKKIKFFKNKELAKVAAQHLARFKKRVTKDGLDKSGMQFPTYSEDYLDQLQSDFKNEDGDRPKHLRGVSLNTSPTKIAKRQFQLRGNTMRNLDVRKVETDSYTLGWDGEAAEIVEVNAARKKKRDVINDIPDIVDEVIVVSNNSTDDTEINAKNAGATVLKENRCILVKLTVLKF